MTTSGEPVVVPSTSPDGFTCDPAAPLPSVELRRLTDTQLAWSIETISESLAPGWGAWARDAVSGSLAQIPADRPTDELDYRRMSQEVSQAHVDGYFRLGRALGDALAESPAALEAWAGSCAVDGDSTNDDACLEGLLERLGPLVFRRPLIAAERELYRSSVDERVTDIAGRVRLLVSAMLMSPPFLYVLENGEPTSSPDTFALDAYALATRLSLHFWQSGPDADLLAAAASGELDSDQGYAAQVARLLDDPRADRSLDTFFEDWLELQELPALDAATGRADFRAYAGDDLPTGELRERLIADVLTLARHVVRDGGDLAELLTTRASYATTDDVANLYGGVPLWTPGTEPPLLPAGERSGVLTRPALLANNQAATRPIIRGVRVLRRVLCDELELPDDMQGVMLGDDAASASTRDRVAALTQQEGSVCVSCHGTINPLGFPFEGYDALGRVRDEQRVYDANGTLVGTFPLDTTGAVLASSTGASSVGDAIELSDVLAESGKVQACFVRQYYRHVFGRREDLRRDGCLLEVLRTVLESGGGLRDVFEAIALHPDFKNFRKEDA